MLQTAVPQIAGCLFAVLLAFFSLVDLLLLHVQERRQEIGLFHALGWKSSFIQRLLWQEGIVLALVGSIPGVLLAFWLSSRLGEKTGIWIVLAILLFTTLLALLAVFPAARAARNLKVSKVLRTE